MPKHRRAIALVSVAGAVLGAVVVFGFLASRPIPPPGTTVPFPPIHHDPLSKPDALLTGGDGRAFAVIAEDPTLSRPSVLGEPWEPAHRAQRPVWGYLTWAVSLGQARFTEWVLLGLTILSCAAAYACVAGLPMKRQRSVWWSLLVPIAGFETLTEATPELLSLVLVAGGVWLWERQPRASAVLTFSVAVLTRETMLIAVAVVVLWSLVQDRGAVRHRVKRGACPSRSRTSRNSSGSPYCGSGSETGRSTDRRTV